ncbi:MAG: Sapep family Mn(2+)-dependent dipeptidase [Erysipelotrichaceae bacterium]|nr:Sapep family Mn(2+)-dependent dipeptidase [Erysipelotrichaceae bacterium]
MDYKQLFINNLDIIKDLLAIKSIYDENSVSETAPYGKSVKDALLFMKELAIKDGFIVKEYDNKVLTISYVTNEDKHIDIASHLDVVSVDDKWNNDPFEPTIIDNKIYGRGTSDMKIPLMLTYIALKQLRDKYPNPNKELRLVLGTDEERTMEDMHYYYNHVSKPLFAFTPDGSFPMGIGELGALMWTIDESYCGIIDKLEGGIQCNVVAPNCYIRLTNNLYTNKIKDYIFNNKIDAKVYEQENKTIIETNGKAVHSSLCYLGDNAIIKALKIIKDNVDDKYVENLYHLFSNCYGDNFDCKVAGEYNTFFTVNLGRLTISENKITAQIDGRYPNTITSEELIKRINNKSLFNINLVYDDKPTLCNKDDKYVQCLLGTYRNITNDYSDPLVSGSVTYSKVFKHCVSFGPNKLGKPHLAHQVNEYMEIDDCVEALEIYYKAMERLLEE